MTIDYTAYDNAHSQPFDKNALACQTDDWRLYDAAHADPAAVPIENIQASPANIVEAGATAHSDTSEPPPMPTLAYGLQQNPLQKAKTTCKPSPNTKPLHPVWPLPFYKQSNPVISNVANTAWHALLLPPSLPQPPLPVANGRL